MYQCAIIRIVSRVQIVMILTQISTNAPVIPVSMEGLVQTKLMDMFVAVWQDMQGLTVKQVSEKTK